jgi:hypothetical protein
MKRKIAAGSVAAIVLVALSLVVASAAMKADFSGKWTMDKAKSEGVPPGMEQTMTITQTGDKIDLETKITGGPMGERIVKDSYTADGKETDFTPQGPQGAMGKGKRTTKWTADGTGLEVSETATLDGPNGAEEVSATRKWTLAPDGKTLTIELTFRGSEVSQQSKRVFVKQ